MRRDGREARALLERELPLIRRIIRITCRRRGMNPQDAEEFESHVMLALVEDDYRRLRKYEGRSSLATYLTTVVQRLFFDHIIAKRGKWRPSARARGLGKTAMDLERLVVREGLSFDSAVSVMQDDGRSEKELYEILLKLPKRHQRASEVSIETAGPLPEPSQLNPARKAEVDRQSSSLSSKLEGAIGRLPEEEQLLLKLRFFSRWKARQIGSVTGESQSRVFTRIERVLRKLRKDLEEEEVTAAEVRDLLQWGELELDLAALPPAGGMARECEDGPAVAVSHDARG